MAAEPTSRQLVVFSLGTEEYALPIEQVHEIIRYTEPRAVNTSDRSVRGVISLRGRIVPVLDLSERLAAAMTARTEDRRIVVVACGAEMVGVVVDSVTEVITIEPSQFSEAPLVGAEYISELAQVDDRLLVLLDSAVLTGKAPAAQSDDESQAVA